MKNLFILPFLILITQSSYSQKYIPLVKEGKYWIYFHYDHSDCFQMEHRKTEIRYFTGDTIIKGQSYKKLVSSFVPINEFPYRIISKQTLCLMREDTILRRVYVINNDESIFPCIDSVEICIWDFSLKAGDTLTNCMLTQIYPFEVDEFTHNTIDSIAILTDRFGYNRRNFFTYGVRAGQCNDPGFYKVAYLEGFGRNDGPIHLRFGTNLHDYCEGTLDFCNIISNSKDENQSISFSLFPNPVSDNLTIQSNLEYKKVDVIDKNGRTVLSGNSKEINFATLPSGMYYLKLITTQNDVYFRKIIKL